MDRTVERRGRRKPPPAEPRALALGWLARRPLCRQEIRTRLAARGVDADEIERTVEGLVAERLLDDEALALDFIVLRSGRLRLGKRRLLRELEQRGVDPVVAERAYERAVENGDLDPREVLRDAVAARLKRERKLDAAARRRVYNALLRAGFPTEGLYAELKRQSAALESAAEDEYDDESP